MAEGAARGIEAVAARGRSDSDRAADVACGKFVDLRIHDLGKNGGIGESHRRRDGALARGSAEEHLDEGDGAGRNRHTSAHGKGEASRPWATWLLFTLSVAEMLVPALLRLAPRKVSKPGSNATLKPSAFSSPCASRETDSQFAPPRGTVMSSTRTIRPAPKPAGARLMAKARIANVLLSGIVISRLL